MKLATWNVNGIRARQGNVQDFIEREQPDVALIDVRMPAGGGIAAVRGIAECSPSTKMIAMSAFTDRSLVLGMLEAGAVGHLVKGTSIRRSLELVKRVAEGQRNVSVEGPTS